MNGFKIKSVFFKKIHNYFCRKSLVMVTGAIQAKLSFYQIVRIYIYSIQSISHQIKSNKRLEEYSVK